MPSHREFAGRLEQLAAGFQHAQLLFTAIEADLFKRLEAPREVPDIAQQLRWPPRGTRMLLDGLVALGLLEKRNGAYLNAPIASACLVEGGPHDQSHILRHKAYGRWKWMELPEAVRHGGPSDKAQEQKPPEERRAFILGMADIGRESAKQILEQVDLSPYTNMLDIGAGPGTYALTFLEAHEGMEATLFDLPDVIPIAQEQAEAAGLEDRVEFQAGDLTRDDFGGGYDFILVSNILHCFGADVNREVVGKCFDALESGGLLMLKDFFVEPGRTGPPFSLIFAVHMLLNTEAGDTYSTDEVAAWTQDAGFGPGERVDLTPQTRLWLVEKP